MAELKAYTDGACTGNPGPGGWENWTGLGYNLLNIVFFIILQPVLILIFFVLWRLEVFKHKRSKY